MQLLSLINKYTWKEVKPQLLKLYSEETEEISRYEDAFHQLSNLEIKGEFSKMRILIEQHFDENEDPYFDVSGIVPNDIEKYGLAEIKWEIWLKMEIDNKTLSQFSEIDCLVHCLWEMTSESFED